MDSVCRLFMKSECKNGENCKWIHDYDLCRDLYFGKCKFGDNCKYYHGGDRDEWLDRGYKGKGKQLEKPSKHYDEDHETKNDYKDSNKRRDNKDFNSKTKYGGRKKKNTTDFAPNHSPPDLRVYIADGQCKKFKHPSGTEVTVMDERDVVLVGNMFSDFKPLHIYNKLLDEINMTGDFDDLWKLWHNDSHLIADDKSHIKWKKQCPTFNMVLERMTSYFDMDVKATRFNQYRNSDEWKPFHHDAAAVDPNKAKTQNVTVSVSFGATRDITFQHAKSGNTVSFPLGDGFQYTFARQVNVDWKHGVPQVHPDDAHNRGRISIVMWGWNKQHMTD